MAKAYVSMFGSGGDALPAVGGDQNFASVSLLVGNDSQANTSTTFADQSNNHHAVTANGNVQYDTAQFPSGLSSAVHCDGTGDFLSVPDHVSLRLASGDFTVEGFVRFANVSGIKTMFSKRASSSAFSGLAVIAVDAGFNWYATSDGATWDIASASPIGTVAADTWYHFAITRSGSTWRAFLGGVKNATEVTSSAALQDAGNAVLVGADSDTFSHNGWFAAVRVTKGVARYTADFTPPSLPLASS